MMSILRNLSSFLRQPERPTLADQFLHRPAMLPRVGKQGRIHLVLVAVPGFPDFRVRRYTIARDLSPPRGDFVETVGGLRQTRSAGAGGNGHRPVAMSSLPA
jgi:hypothetical protein